MKKIDECTTCVCKVSFYTILCLFKLKKIFKPVYIFCWFWIWKISLDMYLIVARYIKQDKTA